MKRSRSITLDPVNTIAWVSIFTISVLFAAGLVKAVF